MRQPPPAMFLPPSEHQTAIHFGAFLKSLRGRHSLRQLQVLAHLPGWTQANYSRMESSEIAPAFDQLVPIYTALCEAGVQLTPPDRQQFLLLARQRIEIKKTCREIKSDHAWDTLRVALSQFDHTSSANETPLPHQDRLLSRPNLMETRHLLGRADWLASVITSMAGRLPKKLIVLQGPTGIGKSSELHRLAQHFLAADPRLHLVFCVLPNVEERPEPENALDQLLGSLLVEIGPPDAAMTGSALKLRMAYVMSCLEKTPGPVVVLVDNAEHLLHTGGQLAPRWKQFLKQFLSSQHHTSLVLATKEWPGWYEGEHLFVAERMIPSLTVEEGVGVLQRLGLATVPLEYLQRLSEAVGGIPLCLEWAASLVQKPLLLDSWDELDDLIDQEEGETEAILTRRVLRLLEDHALFGGDLASRLTPMLERIIDTRLSVEGVNVLHMLSLATLPLGKLPLQRLCPRPSLLRELRTVSLLTAHAQRVQVLPMVAAVVSSRLSPEQRQLIEEQLIDAYRPWLDDDSEMSDREMGAIIGELATLYLKRHRLLEAAQLLIRYGWLSFNQGYAPRLARLAQEVMQQIDWHTTDENQCGGFLLHYHLSPFLGKTNDARRRFSDYQLIREMIVTGRVTLHPPTEVYITHHMMVYAMNELRFEEAQALLETCYERLALQLPSNTDLQASLIEKRAILFGTWCEYFEELGNRQAATELREQAIDLYQRCCNLLLSSEEETPPRQRAFLKKRLAFSLNDLGYHLNRVGKYEEALEAVQQSIEFKEQGYLQFGGLAASYGEKSQILAALGRFQEALHFDERAMLEAQRLADAKDSLSQEEVWIYRVNRGHLYLLLGRVDEAEHLIKEALPNIHARRRMYIMFAKDALNEIDQWRRSATSSHYYLDWRWVETYRRLASFDSFGWLAPAGPFLDDEKQEWDGLLTQEGNEEAQRKMEILLARSRERELSIALQEQHEPQLWYPVIPLDEVHSRIADFLQLDAEVIQYEPNAILRRFYHDAIESQINFLRLIEAAAIKDCQRFQQYNQLLNPDPTSDEMSYTLSRVRRLIQQGLARPDTVAVSQQVLKLLRERFHLIINVSTGQEDPPVIQAPVPSSVSTSPRLVSPQTAKRFFEAVLQEYQYEGWQVILDLNAQDARIEQGLRHFILPTETQISISKIRDYLSHELGGHIARCVAGERSHLGLLGVSTSGSLTTEEGLAVYYDRQTAALEWKRFDESGIWLGTLAGGLARGVIAPPQTFLSLFTFFEALFLLYRLLWGTDKDLEASKKRAHNLAIARCLRTFRGVPDLKEPGLCYTRDVHYLRGLQMVERAVAADETVVDKLAVGVVAVDQLPDLQELGIVNTHQQLRKLASASDLEAYVLSFENSEERPSQYA
jgi:tetratricopeptide (TPR) repeat protein